MKTIIDNRYCNARGEVNETKTCPAGEIVMINVATQSWSCGADDQRCPGAFSVGCEPTLNLCDRKANPYGDCCGAGQLWINDDCSEVSLKQKYKVKVFNTYFSAVGFLL